MGDPNKELISLPQAQMLMVFVLIAAPVIGLAWGLIKKRVAAGAIVGLLIGVGNFALWTVYQRITETLGLDTVKNLLVNLGLFITLGIFIGIGAGAYAAKTNANK